VFGQNVTEHNPAPSPSGHPLLSGPPTLNDIHQIIHLRVRFRGIGFFNKRFLSVCTLVV
jgi:hypothetical protein